ncbi:hypothetical protein [Phytoactinopolyspora mesophila]|uniref:Uncharacterized protein n=1 Tax=Phytoactinopolyspora mesophila TaxID=2650750 RepID=A0A7K3M6J2_9ACTN|nr:hypothetical protein [Phytoactinopolyspora mesophila]NDL58931.1 hypothetical protein [Phytoactinopolyspora mesophila]
MANRTHWRWAAAVVVGVLAAGCDAPWSAPQGPLTAGGARVDDEGRFEFWLGAECGGVGRISVELTERDGNRRVLDTWHLSADDAGGELEYITLGTTPDGFTETTPLNTDWTEADLVRISVHPADPERSADGEGRFYPAVPIRANISVDSFLRGADDNHDQWYVQDQGWYTEAEYLELGDSDDMIHPYCDVPDA